MESIEQTENDSPVLMSLDEVDAKLQAVRKTAQWNALTPMQQNWVRNLLATNQNYFVATKMSYNAKTDAYARTMSHEVRNHPAVRDVLALVFPQAERDERREFFAKLQRRILKGSLTIAQIEGVKIICKERSWEEPQNLPPGRNRYVPINQRPLKHFIGEAFRQNGQPFKATAVDETGENILDAADISEDEFTRLSREQSEKRDAVR